MTNKKLFSPYKLGQITLSNRIVLAPLTRSRAGKGFVPGEFAATYYSQRASAGLLIAEATQISQQGQGYQDTPGIYTQDQIEGWRKVTDAVHAKGGVIFLQIWHVGRISHVELQKNGAAPVAPSEIQANAKVFINNSLVQTSIPRALSIDEIPGIVDDFRQAAANAIAAGFDGVEVHGANGYLLDQFVRDNANNRVDAYGGSIENRARLLLEVTKAVIEEVGADRTGVRISPVSPINDVVSREPQAQFNYIATELSKLGAVYLHVVEGATGGARDDVPFDFDTLRQNFKNTYIANNGYDLNLANISLAENKSDLISFGRFFISNPDLVERFKSGSSLSEIDAEHLYGGGAKGYIDYPTLS